MNRQTRKSLDGFGFFYIFVKPEGSLLWKKNLKIVKKTVKQHLIIFSIELRQINIF